MDGKSLELRLIYPLVNTAFGGREFVNLIHKLSVVIAVLCHLGLQDSYSNAIGFNAKGISPEK